MFVIARFFAIRSNICLSDGQTLYPNLTSGLYYKHMTIVNYASSIVNKLEAFLTDDARVIIYDRHVFIVQATAISNKKLVLCFKVKKMFFCLWLIAEAGVFLLANFQRASLIFACQMDKRYLFYLKVAKIVIRFKVTKLFYLLFVLFVTDGGAK